MAKLTLAQQRSLLRALPASRIAVVRKHCRSCEQRGDGFMDIVRSVGRALGPVAKEIGPTILKELVLPMLKKKIAGKGLRLAGQRR